MWRAPILTPRSAARIAGMAASRRPLAGLHGTSGGRAERVEGLRQRRTVKTDHHAVLGSLFLTHPPTCRFRVDVAAHPLTGRDRWVV